MKSYAITGREDGDHVWYNEEDTTGTPISVIIDADLTLVQAAELLEILANVLMMAQLGTKS